MIAIFSMYSDNILFTVFIRLRNRFLSASHGAMTLLYGLQFNKLDLYRHVKMCLFQTNWKQGTVHRISLHPQLSTLVYREYVVRREQQGEVRREPYFQFFTLNSVVQRNLVFIKKKGKQSFKSLFSVDDEPPTMTMCTAVFSTFKQSVVAF